jgi:Prolipoprotein diacylglyceryltransferase
MIFELSDFFNNPSLVEIGPLKIQYYAVTWLLSAVLIYMFLSRHTIIKELGLNKDEVNDMVFLYGLFFGAVFGGRIGIHVFLWNRSKLNK